MRTALSRAELLLLLFCTPLLLLGLFGPPVPDPAGYHAFADQRTLWGVPYAADVLSNAAFALAAVVAATQRCPWFGRIQNRIDVDARNRSAWRWLRRRF